MYFEMSHSSNRGLTSADEGIMERVARAGLKAYHDLLNKHKVKYVQLPLDNIEGPPIDIWLETFESIIMNANLLLTSMMVKYCWI